MDDSDRIEWRRDASTTRSVRILWALGVGTFFAMIVLVVFWRLYGLTGQVGGQSILVAAAAALVVFILAFGVAGATDRFLNRITAILPGDTSPSTTSLRKLLDAMIGTLVMGGIIVALMAIGRVATESGVLGVGAGPFTGMAALLLPLALVALLLSSFLRSVGGLDVEERTLYLHEPEAVVDLEMIESVSIHSVGDAAVISFEYAQPGGQYVPGPRRLVVPHAVAVEIRALVEGGS